MTTTPNTATVQDHRTRLNAGLRGMGIELAGPVSDSQAEILTVEALGFLGRLARQLEGRRQVILNQRVRRQLEWDDGRRPEFLPDNRRIRETDWRVASIPPDLLDRRVEITGPVDRKMIINALNSGANVFMADFEDANSPTWENCVHGQINLRDAVRREIAYTSPDGRGYELGDSIATLLVRPRGWHLTE